MIRQRTSTRVKAIGEQGWSKVMRLEDDNPLMDSNARLVQRAVRELKANTRADMRAYCDKLTDDDITESLAWL
jgi:hypothetical protein